MLSLPAHSQGYDRHRDSDRMHDARGNNMRDRDHDRRHDDMHAAERHEFRRGERLPGEYRNRQYVVDDWRGHRLNRPPRGYHWVQVGGGDYVLVSIGSGVIANVVIGH
jgi:Ni/Co efflux regulator RcnB